MLHYYVLPMALTTAIFRILLIDSVRVYANDFILTAKKTVPPDIRTILQEKRLYKEYVFQKVWKQFSTGKIVQEIIHKKFLTNKENGMTLYILRHGIAEQRSMQKPDRDRALIPKGRKKVERIIEKLYALSFEPDIILTSPYKRVLETARIAAGKIPTAPPIKTTAALKPSGSFDMLIQLIREKGAQSCCIVGHEPHLSSFASYLLTDTENVSITLKKAGICCLSFYGDIQKGNATLEWLFQPAMLKA